MSEILGEDYLSRWERALEGEPLSQVAPICVGEIHKFIASHRALQAERDALKAQHENLVLRNRLLRDRTDLPVERIQAYDDLMQRCDVLKAELAEARKEKS